MSKLTVAALQLAFSEDTDTNIRAVSELVREAAGKGAEVVLPPELFEGPYFCRVEDRTCSRLPVRLRSTRPCWQCRPWPAS